MKLNIDFLKKDLKKMGVNKIKNQTGLSRSHINSILSGAVEPKVETMNRLLSQLGYTLEIVPLEKKQKEVQNLLTKDDYVIWALSQYNMPMRSHNNYSKLVGLSELLLASLDLGRKNNEIHRVLPQFIYVQYDKISWEYILSKSTQLKYLKYILALLGQFVEGDKSLAKLNLPKIKLSEKMKIFEPINNSQKVTNIFLKHCDQVSNPVAKSHFFYTTEELATLKRIFKRQMVK